MKLIADTSFRGKMMLIEDDGSEDGRLVADGLTPEDAEYILKACQTYQLMVEIQAAISKNEESNNG